MFISFAHFYFPKIFGFLAFFINPFFIYLIFTGDKSSAFGNYRFLLLAFSIFNVIYSIMDILVPIEIHSYRYCFYVFVSDGFFMGPSNFNKKVFAARCSLISTTYSVLIIHFLYRYLAISQNILIGKKFKYFMGFGFLLSSFYFWYWFAICIYLISENADAKEYIKTHFLNFYGSDPSNLNVFPQAYQEVSQETILRTWMAVISATVISFFSITVFSILAFKIMNKLNKMTTQMSQATSKQQKELLRALIIQTIIPIFVSFGPCVIGWFAPVFDITLPRAINGIEVIALSAFPFCDPLAIILCLPMLRNRIFKNFNPTNQIHSAVANNPTN